MTATPDQDQAGRTAGTPPKEPNVSRSIASVTPLLLTPEEAAEALRVGRSKVYDLIRSGRLRSVKVDGARRIPMTCLMAFVESLSSGDAA
jgi:excisionase family DNA binding protein